MTPTRLDMPELEPADIILTHNTGLGAGLVQLVTRSYWSHTLLVESVINNPANIDYAVIEAIPRGLAFGTLNTHYKDTDIAVYRIRDDQIGIRSHVPERFLELPKRQQFQELVLLEAKKRGRYHYDHFVLYHIWKAVGTAGMLDLLNCLLHGLPLNIPHKADEYVVCSELVQEAYEAAGSPLILPTKLLMPGNIARLRHTLLTQVYGKPRD